MLHRQWAALVQALAKDSRSSPVLPKTGIITTFMKSSLLGAWIGLNLATLTMMRHLCSTTCPVAHLERTQSQFCIGCTESQRSSLTYLMQVARDTLRTQTYSVLTKISITNLWRAMPHYHPLQSFRVLRSPLFRVEWGPGLIHRDRAFLNQSEAAWQRQSRTMKMTGVRYTDRKLVRALSWERRLFKSLEGSEKLAGPTSFKLLRAWMNHSSTKSAVCLR
jgi:hypothetical protein